MPFTFQPTRLEGVFTVQPKVFSDDRGFFMEVFKASDFKQIGIEKPMTQVNHSSSTRGVLRGLHYQIPPHAQAKLVRCIRGAIFDVAVNIQKNSPQFGQWFGAELSENNKGLLYIPEGFAHGFYTLTEKAEVMYLTTDEYAPTCDRGIVYNDPAIGIAWPEGEMILSDKDMASPVLNEAEVFV